MLSDEERVELFRLKGIEVKVGDYFPDESLESLDVLLALAAEKTEWFQLCKGKNENWYAEIRCYARPRYWAYEVHSDSPVTAMQIILLQFARGAVK